MSWIKLIVLLIVLIYVLVGLFLFLFQERMVFHPEKLDLDYDFKFKSEFDELNLEMEDGAMLNALHFKVDQPRGIIVYFHGNAGNLARWGEVVEPFTKYGFEILVVDYRGYGKSTGKRSKEMMLQDAEMVYGYAANLWSQDQIIVFGRSLGSAFACHVAGTFQPQQLILESPFFSVADVARELTWMYPTEAILTFNFHNDQSADKIKCPISIIHGSDDRVVPLRSGKKLFDEMSNAQFEIIQGGDHNDLAAFKDYWNKIDELLK